MRMLPATLRLCFTLACCAVSIFATSLDAKNWNSLSGNWNTGANWNPAAVPVAGEEVNIINADGTSRTVTLDVSTPMLGLTTINQTGGTAVNTLSISGNNFSSSALFIGGWTGGAFGTRTTGRGAVTQSGGTVTMNSGNDLALANGVGSFGTYTLSGGSFTAPQSEFIGYAGTGTFTQTGGLNTIAEGTIGSLNFGALSTGNGTYNLSGTGQLVSGKSIYVGDAGVGSFVQTGGSVNINSTTDARNDLYLGNAATATGTYTISGGTLNVADEVYVGLNGAGTFNIQPGANVFVGDRINIGAGDTVNMSGGTLRLLRVARNATGTINFTGGTIVAADGTSQDNAIQEFFGPSIVVTPTRGLAFEGQVRYNKSIEVNNALLAFQGQSADPWAVIGGPLDAVPTLSVINGGDVTVAQSAYFALGDPDFGPSKGNLVVSGVGSTFTNNSLFNAVDGTVTVNNGATMTTNGNIAFTGRSSNVTATVSGAGTTWNGGGFFSVANANVTISNGASVSVLGSGSVGGSVFEGRTAATALITGPGTLWSMAGNLNVSSPDTGIAYIGTVTIQDQASVYVGLNLNIDVHGSLSVTNSTLRVGSITATALSRLQFNSGTLALGGNHTFGTDPVITQFWGANALIQPGKALTIEGTATVQSGITIDGGTLRVGSLAVSNSFQFRGGTFEVLGGSITGLTTLVIPGGGEFRSTGTQTVNVAGDVGSTITATGNLSIGNAANVNGFGTLGTLNVAANTVTLLDANDAVFASLALASLGNGASPGTLNSANGLTLDFGGNIAGFGTVSTPNNSSKPLINNGHITGNSAAQKITLTGYVKGVGSLDNVTVTGTLAPGFSPAIVTTTNLGLASTGTLLMELGGTIAGSSYDQLQDAGQLTLGGALQVALINGFTPALGNSFDLLNWSTLSGAFSSLSLPQLSGGLTWNTSQLYTTGVLSVVGPAGVVGDYNNNGTVDAADYVVWRKSQGTNTVLPNDPTGGTIGTAQYNAWRANFGKTPGNGAGSSDIANAAVPEPGNAGVLLIAVVGVFAASRRRDL